VTYLVQCTHCLRHVRSDENECPFCGTSIAVGAALDPGPPAATQRLARAAMAAVRATLAGSLVSTACSIEPAVPIYGISPSPNGGTTAAGGTSGQEPMPTPIYGISPAGAPGDVGLGGGAGTGGAAGARGGATGANPDDAGGAGNGGETDSSG